MSVQDIIDRLTQMRDSNETADAALLYLTGMDADEKEALTEEGEQRYADILYSMAVRNIG